MKYELENGEAMNRQHPDKFHIPPQSERETLLPGDFAKVVFLANGEGERMWVEVSSADADAATPYEGTLGNQPIVHTELTMGDLVQFGPEHVIQIMRGDE
jgi:hypothetical protein